MKQKIKVTIMIPCYNQEKTIAMAIESALKQTYKHKEIIVVDDCSKDNSWKIISSYKGITAKKNKKNLGRHGNYHTMLNKHATGDYVLNLDGDDYFTDETFIEKAVSLIESYGLIMVFGNQEVHIERTNKKIKDKVNDRLSMINDGNDLFFQFTKGVVMPHNATLYNRKKAIEVDMYRAKVFSCEWMGFLKMMVNNKVGYIDSFVTIWRKHGNNVTSNISMNEILTNTTYITESAAYARAHGLSTKRWENVMLTRYYSKHIMRFLWKKQKSRVKETLAYVKKHHRFIYPKMKFLATMISLIFMSKLVTKIVFKYIIGLESYFEEYS